MRIIRKIFDLIIKILSTFGKIILIVTVPYFAVIATFIAFPNWMPFHTKQDVQIFLPEGYCDSFTVFYEEDSAALSPNTVVIDGTSDAAINIFRWNGEKGVILHRGIDDLAIGISFHYFNKSREEQISVEFKNTTNDRLATQYKVRPKDDACGDNIPSYEPVEELFMTLKGIDS